MSDIVDELSEEVYQSSGEEWVEQKRTTRRTSHRLRKKPRITTESSDTSDSDTEVKSARKSKSKQTSVRGNKNALQTGMKIINKNYMTGGFLVAKKDVQSSDSKNPPCLWRIDGKALLQKYEFYDDEGKKLHRSTSVYTGWTLLDKDLYAPINVKVQWHSAQQVVVSVNWETLKNATMDSD